MRATSEAVRYEELEPLELKGKVEPVPAWEAVGLIVDARHCAGGKQAVRRRSWAATTRSARSSPSTSAWSARDGPTW